MKLNGFKRKGKYFKILYLVIGIIVLILIYFSTNKEQLSSAELFFKGIINKIQSIYYKDIDILKSDELLSAENESLKGEIKELKELMNLQNIHSDYSNIYATVIYRNVGYWYDNLTINKGRDDGVKSNMLVISSSGLVGITKNVTKYSSDVLLLTSINENSKISVGIMYDNDIVYGLINGYDHKKGELIVDNIVADIEYKENINVVTSGLTSTFKEGILIGEVSAVENDKYDLSKIVRVKCSANFSNIRYVSVLGEKK